MVHFLAVASANKSVDVTSWSRVAGSRQRLLGSCKSCHHRWLVELRLTECRAIEGMRRLVAKFPDGYEGYVATNEARGKRDSGKFAEDV